MEHTTIKGTTISINENGIATASHKSCPQPLMLGNEQGIRYLETMAVRATTLIDKGRSIRAIAAYDARGRRLAFVGLDAETISWLESNWAMQKSAAEIRAEKWLALMPADAKAMREWGNKMDNWQREFNRCMEDEMRSSFAPKKPTDPKPELTPEGKAWLELDAAQYASLYYKAGFAKDAIDKAINGTPLVDACNEYNTRLDEETDKHIWD